MKSLLKRGLSSMSLKIARIALGMVSTWLLTRWMQQDDFGLYSLALSLSVLLAIPGEAGIPQFVTREIARKRILGDAPGLRSVVRFANAVVIGLTIITAAAACTVLWIGPFDLDRHVSLTITVVLLAVLLGSLSNTRAGIMRGLGYPLLSQVPEQLVRPAAMIALSVAVIFTGTALSATTAITLYVGASAIAFVFGSALLYRRLRAVIEPGEVRYDTRAWLGAILPFSLIAGTQVATGQVATITLGLVRPPEDVAIFRIAVLIGDLVNLPVLAMGTLLGPQIVQLFHKGDTAGLQQLVRNASRLITAVSLAIFAGIVALGPFVLPFAFGEAYRAAYEPLCVYAGGQLLCASTGVVATVASMCDREKLTMVSAILGLGLITALSLILCPRLGPIGASIAVAASMFIAKLALAAVVDQKLSIRTASWWWAPKKQG